MDRSPPWNGSPTPVFPAYAGMDRKAPRSSRASPAFSPHTRGWTARPGDDLGHDLRFPRIRGDGPKWQYTKCSEANVFPAYAGMDRCTGTRTRGRPSFPRIRGDGPSTNSARCSWRKFSPHTRGWTARRLRGGGRASFSPHTRGWTAMLMRTGAIPSVFPAYAGMDRSPQWAAKHHVRFPRIRGDGPRSSLRIHLLAEFSPHTRGWTDLLRPHALAAGGFPRIRGDGPLALARGERVPVVFPAYAGMDRHRAYERPLRGRFPRIRGDGPIQEVTWDDGYRGFPRTRRDGPSKPTWRAAAS